MRKFNVRKIIGRVTCLCVSAMYNVPYPLMSVLRKANYCYKYAKTI